jgi:hypothetical protein
VLSRVRAELFVRELYKLGSFGLGSSRATTPPAAANPLTPVAVDPAVRGVGRAVGSFARGLRSPAIQAADRFMGVPTSRQIDAARDNEMMRQINNGTFGPR